MQQIVLTDAMIVRKNETIIVIADAIRVILIHLIHIIHVNLGVADYLVGYVKLVAGRRI